MVIFKSVAEVLAKCKLRPSQVIFCHERDGLVWLAERCLLECLPVLDSMRSPG